MFYGSEHSTPSLYRARTAAIRRLMEELPVNRDEKNPDRVLVRNGFIPDNLEKRFQELQQEEYKRTSTQNEPLTFEEITSYNTWFAMHPEKVCGKEIVTTSREFPLSVKGTKEDIIDTIRGEQEESGTAFNPVANVRTLLNWTVMEFNKRYFDSMAEFEKAQQPLERKIEQIRQQVKEAGRDRNRKKELNEKLNETVMELNRNRVVFEKGWEDVTDRLRELIKEKAREKGIRVDKNHNEIIPDEILLSIVDRPGIEHYWNTRIGEVIEKELIYNRKKQGKSNERLSELEMEALALERELQLLSL